MLFSNQAFAPYFRNGRLYLPEQTLALLIQFGLEQRIAHLADNGLDLGDHRREIGIIETALAQLLASMEEVSQPFVTLTTAETRFLLSDAVA